MAGERGQKSVTRAPVFKYSGPIKPSVKFKSPIKAGVIFST